MSTPLNLYSLLTLYTAIILAINVYICNINKKLIEAVKENKSQWRLEESTLFPLTKKKKKSYFLIKLGITQLVFLSVNRTKIGQCHTICNKKMSDTYTASHKYYHSTLQILCYIFLLSGKKLARKLMSYIGNTWLDERVTKKNPSRTKRKVFQTIHSKPTWSLNLL